MTRGRPHGRPFLFALLALLFLGAGAPKREPITVLIVRHAEKRTDQGDDPHLSEAGVARANALANVAENAGVSAVYVSQFLRTRETAAALLAKHSDIKVNVLPVEKSADYPKALADAIVARESGKVVLVVSHSNLVPGIVEALSGTKVPAMSESEYSRLYIVTVVPDAQGHVISAQYGCQ